MSANVYHDYLVIGAGPAGIQLGYFLEQNHHDYLILEAQDSAGSFFEKFPRTGTLISFNKVHNIYDDPEILLRWDWNSLLTDDYSFQFKEYSKKFYPESKELVQYLGDFAENYRLKIQYNTKISQIRKEVDGTFVLRDMAGNTYGCQSLIIATGFGKEYIPAIPGIELVTESYGTVSMDPNDFAGQRVLIVGKGNSAYEIADNILDTAALIHLASPQTTRFAWNTRHPGHLRANYTRILDSYQLKLLHGALDCTINEISMEDGKYVAQVAYVHADGEVEEIIYDRVIRCTGFSFNRAIFDSTCMPDLVIDDRFPALTGSWESVNVPGMFFAGTLMQPRDFQRAGSAFIDGFRYNIRTLYHLLNKRYQGEPLPSQGLPLNVETISQAIQHRACRTSALWTQFGYLCDVMTVDEESQKAQYYEELPVDYVLTESEFRDHPHYYTITFEWGPWDGDVFAIQRHPNHETAYTNAFLHPIIRRYSGTTLMAEHHILEDLFGMYSFEGTANVYRTRSGRSMAQYHAEEHDQPLRDFLVAQLLPENQMDLERVMA
ncbi:MAG: NAD(P)-binding domain-containing protein [Chloroflexota bacterium]